MEQSIISFLVYVIGILVAVVGFFLTGVIMDVKQVKKDLSIFKEKFGRLELQTELWWGVIQKHTAEILKSYPTALNKDILLEKMVHNELTLDDSYTLRTILTEELKLQDKDKLVYVLALGRIEQIIFDLKPRKT